MTLGRRDDLLSYYGATPVFILTDAFWGWNLRTSSLLGERGRILYYAGCLAVFFLCRRWPAWTPFLALGESFTNVVLCSAALLVPMLSLTPDISSAEMTALADHYAPASVAGLILSLIIGVLALRRWERKVETLL